MDKKLLRLLTAILLTTMLAGITTSALAAGSFKAVVTSKSMKVYSQDAGHKYLGALKKGTTVTVKDYSGKAALIVYNGNTGVARISDLMAVAGGGNTQESAATAQSAKSVVTTKSTKVYKTASATADYVSVKAGTTLELVATNGSVGKVKKGDTVGYIDLNSLNDSQTAAQTATASTVEASATVQKYDRKAVETAKDCKIYARPSASGTFTSVSKGTALVLLATKGSCAMVEREGKVGYTDIANLTTQAVSANDSAVRTADNTADSNVDLSGNNEQIVFKFLTRVMGYNTAAACGVMANIKYESGYKPSSGGDKGTSYGIVQWHLGRKTRLIEWCGSNGFDYTTLEGQLYYLDYELKNRYPAVHKRLLAVSNDEQGAYDAGYDFCYNFEAPSNRASRSVTRANYARETLWNRYKA